MKRTILIAFILLLSMMSASAQIIYTDEDNSTHLRMENSSSLAIMVPLQNVNYDQWKLMYVPSESYACMMLLFGIGYLSIKKKEDD